jgi:hypothetical protein
VSESEESSVPPPAEAASPQDPGVGASTTGAVTVPTRNQGPIGKPRGVLFVILITIVTLGIYHLYWVFKVFDEIKQHTGEGIGGILGLVIAIVIAPVNYFVLPSEVGKMYRGDGRTAPMTGWTGLWILLPLVGWFVWIVKVQRALNRYWRSEAATAAP